MQDFLFTSESVTEGHPDKVCDQISDAILDAIYTEDPYGRVACETLVTTGLIVISGEITTKCYIDIPKIARQTVIDIGYDRAKYGFDGHTCGVVTSIDEQSTNIAQGVNIGEGLHLEQGAGDQGMMVGYASNETSELMPLPIMLAHKLTMRLSEARKNKIIDYLRPDGKSQITIEYVNGQPKRANTVLVSTQHRENIPHEQIRNDVIEHIIRPVVGAYIDDKTIFHVNPTGSFHMGGPQADTGLTGRKIIVDTYGGMGHHGGGCFSGKDPSKVDRSGAYAARYVAKNVVAAGLADKCEIQVAYAIGVANPVSINVNVFGTGKISEEKILEAIQNTFDLRPAAIIETLNLRKPIYKKTAAYGHFGREEFPWEKTDKADRLKEYLNTSVAPPTPAPTYNATPSSSSYQAPEQSSPQPTNEPFTPPQTTPFDSSGEQQTANTRPGDTSSPFPEPNFDANQSPITPGQNEYREIPRENQNPPIV